MPNNPNNNKEKRDDQDFCRPVSDKGWEEEFDKRFFNPAIPNPSELKKFIKKLYPKQKLQHGRRLQKKDEI